MMMSQESSLGGNPADHTKRIKLQRACDICRKKKIRCDGADMPHNQCSRCVSHGVDCTYEVKRTPTNNYVEVLESRLRKMEELVDKLQSQVGSPSRQSGHLTCDSLPHKPGELSNKATPSCTPPMAPPTFDPASPQESEDLDPSDDEMETSRRLIHKFREFSLRGPTAVRYHGKSSNMMLLQAAVDMKSEYTGMTPSDAFAPPTDRTNPDDRWWNFTSVEDDLPPYTDFPPADLMKVFIDSYFDHLNVYIPLLHRPTLERHIKDGLHLRDESFGAVLLLVCANGCRWIKDTSDPLLEPYVKPQPGRLWFDQVERTRKSVLSPPQLFDLQRTALMVEYLLGFSSPYSSWTLVGLGVRMAQDVGIHRLKTYSSMSREEGGLYKRAFCSLVFLDRGISFSMGRPCAIQDEDFDVDVVEECDDEYWSTGDPETDFKQPPGKPSKLAFLNSMNQLMRILGFTYRTIYSINKYKAQFGFVGEEWEQQIVAELDSALNKWVDTVPDHLRWDPHREDLTFLNQSATLYCNYYLLQIFIHRPFLPSVRKSSRLSLPSLAICTNAARSCVHVSEVQYKRTGQPTMFNRMALLTSGVVLLLSMWGGKRSGLSNQSAAADVQKCLVMIKQLEADPRIPGRHWDILNALYSAGGFEAPAPQTNRKRARDSDDSAGSSSAYTEANAHNRYTPSSSDPHRHEQTSAADPSMIRRNVKFEPTSTSHPVSSEISGNPAAMPSNANSPASIDLPIHTEDLGRVPFHHGFSPYLGGPLGTPAAPAPPRRASETAANGGLYARAGPSSGSANPTVQTPLSQPSPASRPATGSGRNQQPDHGLPTLTVEDLTFADNTLNLWSSAPTSLDWSDWVPFIHNMSDGASGWRPSSSNTDGL